MISPLLANLYMNRFLKYWRITEQEKALRAHVVNYADDFVILTRRRAGEAREWTRGVMARLGLTLNEAKTKIKEAWQEGFDFLGYSLGVQHYRKKGGRKYLGAWPSKKSVARLRQKVNAVLVASNTRPWPEVRDGLNRLLGGWSGYFRYGTRSQAYRAVDRHVEERVRNFLRRRHKIRTRGTRVSRRRPFSARWGCGVCGMCIDSPLPVSLARNPVGEPDAGNPHVRFDERGRETGRRFNRTRAQPRLY